MQFIKNICNNLFVSGSGDEKNKKEDKSWYSFSFIKKFFSKKSTKGTWLKRKITKKSTTNIAQFKESETSKNNSPVDATKYKTKNFPSLVFGKPDEQLPWGWGNKKNND